MKIGSLYLMQDTQFPGILRVGSTVREPQICIHDYNQLHPAESAKLIWQVAFEFDDEETNLHEIKVEILDSVRTKHKVINQWISLMAVDHFKAATAMMTDTPLT